MLMKKLLFFCFAAVASLALVIGSGTTLNAMETDNPAPVHEMPPYAYFFQWLPGVSAQVPVSYGSLLLSSPKDLNSEMPEENKLKSPFSDEQIAVEAVETAVGTVYVWRFPEPERVPLCLFAAFVPRDGKYTYYTIEKSFEDCWVLGHMTDEVHSNYGTVERPADASAFVELLDKAGLLAGEKEPNASFVPARSKE